MNPWKTDLLVTPSHPVQIGDPVVTLGSCFADVVGNYLTENKFNVLINPFGTVYNPWSIHQLVAMIIQKQSPSEDGFVESQDVYFHDQFHSSFYASSKQALTKKIESHLLQAFQFLIRSRFLIVTYGTAFVYRRKDNQKIVANCHKLPSSLFTKELLSVDTILESAHETLAVLKKINPQIQIISTVSPVRHLKDTLPLNGVSKSTLRLCAHELQKSGIDYFPAYEIMMDDLRGYRFYKPDRIHPTEEAESYIVEKFSDQYFSADTKNLLSEWNSIRQALRHKPFQPASAAHQSFLRRTLERLMNIRSKLSVEDEIKTVSAQLV